MPVNGKRKGGAWERKCAKNLSIWMFGDQDVLKREPTSGASKSVYVGDVFPMKQIHWTNFPFIVEVKTGYKKSTPTFWDYAILEKWFSKAYQESKLSDSQKIVFLIAQFLNKPAFLYTNYHIPEDRVLYTVSFPIVLDGCVAHIFAYNFTKLLSSPFEELFDKTIYL